MIKEDDPTCPQCIVEDMPATGCKLVRWHNGLKLHSEVWKCSFHGKWSLHYERNEEQIVITKKYLYNQLGKKK